MAIPVTDIPAQDIGKVLRLEERSFSRLEGRQSKACQTDYAHFRSANADGGEVYIGVDEDKERNARKWRGFPTPEVANAHLQVFEELFPLGQDFSYEFLRTPNRNAGLVLHVTIRETREIVFASDGNPYIRRGAQSLPIKSPGGS